MPRRQFRRLRARLRALLRPGAVAAEIEEEIRQHIEAEAESNLRRGLEPAEARRRALLAFGGADRYREATRDARAFTMLEQTVADVRYALRAWGARPGFTLAAVLVLGLGMGATTAMFSAFDAVALAPLPYAASDRLVRLYQQNSPTNRWGLSAADLDGVSGAADVFSELGAVQGGEAAVAGSGGPINVRSGRATSGFFRALRPPLAAGRFIAVEEDDPSAAPVTVVSGSFAETNLGGILGDGMERFARQQIETTTDLQAVTISPNMVERVGDVLVRRNDVPVLTPADARSLAAALPGAAGVGMQTTAGVAVDVPGDSARLGVMLVGTLADPPLPEGAEIEAGSYFGDADIDSARRVVVLGPTLAERLAGGAPHATLIGRTLRLGAADAEVVGVLAGTKERAPVAAVPATAVSAFALASVERAPTLVVNATRIEDVPRIRSNAEAWLRQRFGTRADAFTVATNEARVDQAQRGILLFKLVMGAITGISIVVGGIGVMNVLLVSIVERTREIGIRKATGARRRDIALQFLTESVTISGFGSVLGVVLGVVVVFAFTPLVRALTDAPFSPAISWTSVVVALAAAVVVGILFGTYPALRAARLAPADAIRHE